MDLSLGQGLVGRLLDVLRGVEVGRPISKWSTRSPARSMARAFSFTFRMPEGAIRSIRAAM